MEFEVGRFFTDKRCAKYVTIAEQFLVLPEVRSAILLFSDRNGVNKIFTSGNLHPTLFKEISFTAHANAGDEEQIIKNKIREIYPVEQIRHFPMHWGEAPVGRIFLGVTPDFSDDHFAQIKRFSSVITADIDAELGALEETAQENNLDAFFKLGLISTDIFIELGIDGTIEHANKAFNRELGYTREQVISKNILDFIFDDDLEGGSNDLKKVLLGRKYLNDWRGRFLTYENKKVWYSFTGINYNNRWYAIARDINDLIYFDHQLIKERERFKFFTESSFEGLGLEVEGKIVDCNRRYFEIFEANLSDIIKQPSDKYIVIDNPKEWGKITTTDEEHTYEIQGKTKSGRLIDLEVSRKPTFHKGKRGKLVALRDITLRKNLEVALQDRNDLHHAIVNNDQMLFGIVSNGIVSELSAGMTSLLGLTNDEAIGKPLHQVLNRFITEVEDPMGKLQKSDDSSNDKIYSLKSNETSFDTEIDVKDRSDKNIILKLSIRPLQESVDNIQLIVFTDVTHIKHNLQKLQLAEEELRNTVQSARLASWYYDFDKWKLKLAPESLNILDLDKLSYDFEEFIDRIHPEDVDFTVKQLQKALNGEEFSVDTRIVLKGKPRYIHLQGFSTKKKVGGRHKPVIKGIIQDISDRKRQELELKEAKQIAEQHTRAKNLFLANMSHEIRTPLNSILGFSQILENKIDNPEARKLLGSIKNSSDTLLKLINDILDLSKIESTKIDLHKEVFSIGKLMDYQDSLFKNIATNKNISFEIQTQLHQASIYFADFYRINQVIMNLINNAVKFTEAGSVSLHIRELITAGQCYLEFQIIDTGIGIDDASKELIFKTFEQANSEITKKFGGTGLGLAIVKGLVEIMGGEISVHSELSEGTTFTVTVAVENRGKVPIEFRQKGHIPTSTHLHTPDNLRILVAEDNATNQLLMEEVFKQLKVKYEIVDDGVQALEKLKQDRAFQMGIFDIQMPHMDGYTAVKKIRDNPEEYSQFPIIALTADATTQEKEHALKNGFDGFLSKPFVINDLVAKINELFASSTPADTSGKIEEYAWTIDMAYMEEVTQNNVEVITQILKQCCDSLPIKINYFLKSTEKEDLKGSIDALHAIKGQICLFLIKKDQDYIGQCYTQWKSFNYVHEAKKEHIYTLVSELQSLTHLLGKQLTNYEKKISDS